MNRSFFMELAKYLQKEIHQNYLDGHYFDEEETYDLILDFLKEKQMECFVEINELEKFKVLMNLLFEQGESIGFKPDEVVMSVKNKAYDIYSKRSPI